MLQHKSLISDQVVGMPEKPWRVFWKWTALAVVIAAFLAWASIFIYKSSFIGNGGKRYFSLFDDAMISMQYAYNLAHGHGLVWSPGSRVEGYTNFLMVLIMAGASLLWGKATAVLAVQILGIWFMLGVAWISMRVAERLLESETNRAHSFLPILIFAAVLAYYPLDYWSLMGMETGLMALLLSLAVFQTLEYARTEKSANLYGASLCMALAYLTRIDSILFVVPILLFLLSVLVKKHTAIRMIRILAGPVLLYALIAAAHEIFRLAYYGELLPNTYYLKLTGMPLVDRLRDGFGFTRHFLVESSVLLAGAALALILRPRKERLFLFSITATAIAYQIWNGGDPWDYWRIMAPTMPFLIILFALAVGAWARVELFSGNIRGVGVILVAVLCGMWAADGRFDKEIFFRKRPMSVEENAIHVNTAMAIADVTKPSATVGVFWAGVIPYYSGRGAIDFLGKNDLHIARLIPDTSGLISWNGMRSVPGHNKYDLDYSIESLRPTFVEGYKWGRQDLRAWCALHYVIAHYQGVVLLLAKNSPAVRWEKLDSLSSW